MSWSHCFFLVWFVYPSVYFRQRISASDCLKHPWLSRTRSQKTESDAVSHLVDHGIECELEFTDTDSGDGKLLDEMDMDKGSDGCRCGSSVGEERSSSVYSSPSDISPTPPPSSLNNHLHPPVHNGNKRPSLDLSKEHLKEFVSRWTDNPYLFDSPRGIITHVNSTAPEHSDNATSSSSSNTSSNGITTTAAAESPQHCTKNDDNNNPSKVASSTEKKDSSSVIVTAKATANKLQTHKATTSTFNSRSSSNVVTGENIDTSQSNNVGACMCGVEASSTDDHGMNCKMECGLNIVSQIRRFSKQLHDELELMKQQCGSCNTIRKYSLSDVSVNSK